MNISIQSKRRSVNNILAENPSAAIIDVTSKATEEYVTLSPFYPHGNIPIPFSENFYSQSVEGIWQGLKVFESHDVDSSRFAIKNMKGIKRTVRKYGRVIGHRKGINGNDLLDYYQARLKIYIPSYEWVLNNKTRDLIHKIKKLSDGKDVILLDYETNQDITNLSKPLSHAFLIKSFIEGNFSLKT